MTQKDNILKELSELNSSLTAQDVKIPYQVPVGYFDGLAAQVIRRIKAFEAKDAAEELNIISPLLSGLSRQMPYAVPANYFAELDPLNVVYDDAKQELSALSPLLNSLDKKMPYAVPEGYFDQLNVAGKKAEPAKVISVRNRNWFRYAAAAVVTGMIIIAGYFYVNERKESGKQVMAKVTKEVKKMNETEQDKLMEFMGAGLTSRETVQVSPNNKTTIEKLLQDVSDEELKDLGEQTEDIGDILMTN